MSIKRISRRRVAAPFMDHEVNPHDVRTGGDVETKINPHVQSGIGGNNETRVDTRVETKGGVDTQSRAGTNVETRNVASGGKDVPQMNRWST